MQRDRFLIGILIGIGVLVLVALILFLSRQGQSQYGDESSPSGVLHNYILALQKRDYERAYRYLADFEGKPDLAQFQQSFLSNQGQSIDNTPVEIGETVADELNQSAFVQMTLIHGSRDLFDSGYRETNTASLVRQNGAWKIQSIPYPYGSWPIKAEPAYTPLPTRTPIPTLTP